MTVTQSTTRTTDSTDRPRILAANSSTTRQPKPVVVRLGGAARRFLNSLMNALATPHV
jgi:hypothetical protein